MPNRDWYFDQFDVENIQGELDITNDQALQDAGLTRDQRDLYETNFIDQLYGTDNAQWTYPDPRATGPREGVPTAEGTGTMAPYGKGGGQINLGTYRGNEFGRGDGIDATWGLDLRRVLNEDLEIGTTEHYEWLTRGEVDWASYENDNAYQKAFSSMKNDKDAWSTYGDPSNIDFLTSDDYTDQQKVDFVRAAGDFSASKNEVDDKWHIPDDFDNKYTAKYHHEGPNKGQPVDPESVQPYEASPLFDPNSEAIQSRLIGADGQRMTIRTDIATASAAGSRRDIVGTARRAGINLRPVNVKRPANIPASWGPVTGGNN